MNARLLGLGIVAPGAPSREAFRASLSLPLPSAFKVEDLGDAADPKARRLPRLDRMALTVAREAVGPHPPAGLGLVFGTGYGGLTATVDFLEGYASRGPSYGSPAAFHQSVHHAPAGQISIALGIRGPCLTTTSRELSGESALKLGLDLLRTGRAERVLVVAADEKTSMLDQGYRAFAPDLRPGEGAAAVLLGKEGDGPAIAHHELCAHPLPTLRFCTEPAALAPLVARALPAAGEHPLVSLTGWVSEESALMERHVPGGRPVADGARLGFHPSAGLLRLVAAALRLERGEAASALVHGLSLGGGQAVTVLTRQ